MKFIPKGVKYIPYMVHTIGMFCKHTQQIGYENTEIFMYRVFSVSSEF